MAVNLDELSQALPKKQSEGVDLGELAAATQATTPIIDPKERDMALYERFPKAFANALILRTYEESRPTTSMMRGLDVMREATEEVGRRSFAAGVTPATAAGEVVLAGELAEWTAFRPDYLERALTAWHRDLKAAG